MPSFASWRATRANLVAVASSFVAFDMVLLVSRHQYLIIIRGVCSSGAKSHAPVSCRQAVGAPFVKTTHGT